MDNDKDDKSIIDKTLEVVKDIAAVAAEAAHKAIEPEPIKPGDEVVVMPMAAAGFIGEAVMPSFVIIPRRTNAPSRIAKESPKKTAKKSTENTAKRPAKKSSKKKRNKAAKRRKPEIKHKTVGKTKKGKKAVKKKAKKSKR
jgi:hypothetical protein